MNDDERAALNWFHSIEWGVKEADIDREPLVGEIEVMKALVQRRDSSELKYYKG